MRFLLDSQVLLWAVYSPELLSDEIRRIFETSDAELFVSHASLWEILAKIGRGKLLLAGTSAEASLRRFMEFGVNFFGIQVEDILLAATLPQHHHDPFDRVIIAQAIQHKIPVITSDRIFRHYDVQIIWQ